MSVAVRRPMTMEAFLTWEEGQELRWEDLVNGDAALAVALNASLSQIPQPDGIRQKRKAKSPKGSVQTRMKSKSPPGNRALYK